jgi:hypothetical protein
MYARKRGNSKAKKQKTQQDEPDVLLSRSPKDEEDNLCPVCEDSCHCGKSGSEESKLPEASGGSLKPQGTPTVQPLWKKRVLVDYSSNTSHSATHSNEEFSSEDDHIFYFQSDSSYSSLTGSTDESADDASSSDSEFDADAFEQSLTHFQRHKMLPEPHQMHLAPTIMTHASYAVSPSQSQVVINKPATFIDVYSSYYMSSSSDSVNSDYDDSKVTVTIEDFLIESATCQPKCSSLGSGNESIEALQRWQKIPICAFRRRTRRQSASSIELTPAIRNCMAKDSIHSTFFSEPFQPHLGGVEMDGFPSSHRHSVPAHSSQPIYSQFSVDSNHQLPSSSMPLIEENSHSTCSSPSWSVDYLFSNTEDALCFWNGI